MSTHVQATGSPRRPARSSDLGVHPLTALLLAEQAAIALVLSISSWVFGIDTDWASAAPAFLAIGTCVLVWLYLWMYPGRNPREWLVGEALLIFGILLMLTVLLLPAQYAVAAWKRPLADPWLAAADHLLGIHVPTITEWVRQRRTLAWWLTVSYQSLGIQFMFTIPVLVGFGRRDELWEYAYHFHACALVTLMAFAVFPAACAFNYYGFEPLLPQDVFTRHLFDVREGHMRSLQFGAMEGLVSAPSFHMAGGLMITWATRRIWWLAVPIVIVNLGLCSATVLTGAHYGVDSLLSIGMFALSVWSWRRCRTTLLRQHDARVPQGGSVHR